MKARLEGSRELGPATRHFDFQTFEWDGAFVPGQFVSLTADVAGNPVTRAYSLASPPAVPGGRFALCANLVGNGRFSPHLFSLHPGEEIDFKGPYGAFIPRRPLTDSIFVATGTGIAPFRSMLLALLPQHPGTRFVLVFGVRYREGLLYDSELRELAAEHPNFDYRPTLTRPPADWTGRTGRVQAHVAEALQEIAGADVYICGLREMVDDLRTKLREAGMDRRRIVYEKYD